MSITKPRSQRRTDLDIQRAIEAEERLLALYNSPFPDGIERKKRQDIRSNIELLRYELKTKRKPWRPMDKQGSGEKSLRNETPIAREQPRNETGEVLTWLRGQCNRYVNGQCTTHGCLKRGGYPSVKNNPTCEAHEAVMLISSLSQSPTAAGENKKSPAGWIKTAERPPTKEDANRDGEVLATFGVLTITADWEMVIKYRYDYWMKIPPVPKDKDLGEC